MRLLRMVNKSTVVKPAEFESAVRRMNDVIDHQLGPAWGVYAELCTAGSARPGQEAIYLVDDGNMADALGYHDLLTEWETPVGFAFAKTALDAGVPWTVPLSHECWEQLVNPWLIARAMVLFQKQRACMIVECADPVEEDHIVLGGQHFSDFVTPAWFGAGNTGTAKLDVLDLVKVPLELRPGGYISYSLDLQRWQQSFSQDRQPSEFRQQHNLCKYSRHARRLALDR
jgi:hypothetical protein